MLPTFGCVPAAGEEHMDRERVRNSLRGTVALLVCLPVLGCGSDTETRKPLSPDVYTSPLQVRAFCNSPGSPVGEPFDEPVVIPNDGCKDNSPKGTGHPGGGPPDPNLILLELHNTHDSPVTLTGIALETDPSQPQDLLDLLEFVDASQECLGWLSNPPTGSTGTVWLPPKTLQPDERCHTVLRLIDPTASRTPPTTGSVVFFGQNSEVLARLLISVGP
jgi:hypothetical protein